MAIRETDGFGQHSGQGWTRRAITGFLASTGLAALIDVDTDAKGKKKKKKKKKGKGSRNSPTCTRTCGNRVCGDDGCGGSCGTCGAGTSCNGGQCVTPNAYEFDRLWYHGLENPWGIAVDRANGGVYVADSNHDRIQKFTNTGEFTREWGSRGTLDGQFHEPAGVAVGNNGFVYVADSRNHRIQKFSSGGEHLLTWGSLGTGNGQLTMPQGIAASPIDGTIFVWGPAARVQRFADGTFLGAWDLSEAGLGDVRSLTVDSDGVVYLVGTGAGCIYRMKSDGTIDLTIGSMGSGSGQLSGPWDVALDADGKIFVADRGNNRVQVFDKNGNFITGWGEFGGGNGQFKQPMGIDLDSDGNVYVTELANARVQKFRPAVARRSRH